MRLLLLGLVCLLSAPVDAEFSELTRLAHPWKRAGAWLTGGPEPPPLAHRTKRSSARRRAHAEEAELLTAEEKAEEHEEELQVAATTCLPADPHTAFVTR
jgi:hypothetical protein